MERISLNVKWAAGREHAESFESVRDLFARIKGLEIDRNSTCPLSIDICVGGRKIITTPGQEIGEMILLIESMSA